MMDHSEARRSPELGERILIIHAKIYSLNTLTDGMENMSTELKQNNYHTTTTDYLGLLFKSIYQ